MEDVKHVIDGVSIGAALAAFNGWLPVVAAGASLVWTIIRIYETKTVQDWINQEKK